MIWSSFHPQQFFDVVNLLSKIGMPSEKHMIVFNGMSL